MMVPRLFARLAVVPLAAVPTTAGVTTVALLAAALLAAALLSVAPLSVTPLSANPLPGDLAAGPGNRPPPKPARHVVPPPADPAVLRQGGDTIADAVIIDGLPFSTTGATTGYTDDHDEVCPYDTPGSPDVVYAYTPPYDLEATFDLCGSGYDTKIYIYDEDLALVACNDDAYFEPPCGVYVSMLEGVPLAGGVQYFVVIDGYGGEHGEYILEAFEYVYVPCVLDCPPDGFPEGEPPLENDHDDLYNGGCNSPGLPMQVLEGDANGELLLCGRTGFYLVEDVNYRDTDWFILQVGDAGVIEVFGDAEQPTYVFDNYQDCGIPEWIQDITVGECDEASMAMLGVPGHTKWVVVLPTTFTSPTGEYPYEYDYVLHFAGLPAAVATERTSWSTIKALFE